MKLDLILVALAAVGVSFAESETRGIVPEELVQARPQPKAASAVAAKPKYQPLGPQVVHSLRQSSMARQVGVTIWRLRPAAPGDTKALDRHVSRKRPSSPRPPCGALLDRCIVQRRRLLERLRS